MNILICSSMIGIRRSFVLWGREVLSSVFGLDFIRTRDWRFDTRVSKKFGDVMGH
jgi:hypothetical protein